MSKIAPAGAPVTLLEVPPGRVIGPGRASATFPEPGGPGRRPRTFRKISGKGLLDAVS